MKPVKSPTDINDGAHECCPPAACKPCEGSRFYKINGNYYIFTTRPPNSEYVLKSATGPFGPYTMQSHHRVGNQRRVYLREVLEFAKKRDKERLAALDVLARDAFKAGLYERNVFPEGGTDE